MRVIGIGNIASRSSPVSPGRPVTAPIDVRALRLRLGMSQSCFAHRFGFPLRTLRRWENGHETPQRPALVLLNLIERNPQVVLMGCHRHPKR
jgi:DNA-binding transcriptional regulator YiaG